MYWARIIPYVAFALPMGIFVMTGFVKRIPYELEEAACLDGCNIYQTFLRIILPLLKPVLATVSIFTYLSSWNELMFANTFINSFKLKTLTVGIMSMAGWYTTEWGPSVAYQTDVYCNYFETFDYRIKGLFVIHVSLNSP